MKKNSHKFIKRLSLIAGSFLLAGAVYAQISPTIPQGGGGTIQTGGNQNINGIQMGGGNGQSLSPNVPQGGIQLPNNNVPSGMQIGGGNNNNHTITPPQGGMGNIINGNNIQTILDVADVNGWAWSYMPDGSNEAVTPGVYSGQGLGWINLNGGAGGNMTFSMGNGVFDGYGWSPYSGWLESGPMGPYPAGAGVKNSAAYVDTGCLSDSSQSSCWVEGWMRFAVAHNPDGTPNPDAGGWDGWVAMHGSSETPGPQGFVVTRNDAYGVKLIKNNDGTFLLKGNAWGGNVAGWIGFDATISPNTLENNDKCIDNKGIIQTYAKGTAKPDSCRMLTCSYVTGIAPNTTTGTINYYQADGKPEICKTNGVPTDPTDPSDNQYTCVDNKGNTVSYSDINNQPAQCKKLTCEHVVGEGRNKAIKVEVYYAVDGMPEVCSQNICKDTKADNYGSEGNCSYTSWCKLHPEDEVCKPGPAGKLKPIFKEN